MNMHRIVHLDLKGAPLKVPYMEQVLLKAKQWGATGILFEWEDTFPYSGDLEPIGSIRGCGGDDMYSKEEVRHILEFCKQNGLEAIQLIQTIGHMEFVLKHPAYRGLRESPRSPAVLCPSRAESLPLVTLMLEQALEAQPGANYLHIGADEVWYLGICEDCQKRIEGKHEKAFLFLEHIREVVRFVKQKNPDVTVLMWDDMLRSVRMETMKEYELGELIQPVLWHYNPKECFKIDAVMWDIYRQIFKAIWAGSAFKGANGSCQIVSPVSRYVSNQEAWLREFNKYKLHINFGGIILTGWSRFDHYATLCELLPVSMPSLASCLRVLCKSDTDQIEKLVCDSLPFEEWPGEDIAKTVHAFVALRDKCLTFLRGDSISTWLNPWQLENSYTNPVQIEGIAITAQHLLSELSVLGSEVPVKLRDFTGRRSADEWTNTLVTPLHKKLSELRDLAMERALTEASVAP